MAHPESLLRLLVAAQVRIAGADRARGDVPGWVMITVMTAALVVAILVPFRTVITEAISTALSSVTGAAG